MTHAVKVVPVQVQFQSFLTSTQDRGKLSSYTTSGKKLKRKLGGPTAGMGAFEYWKISGLCRKSNHDSSVVHSLY